MAAWLGPGARGRNQGRVRCRPAGHAIAAFGSDCYTAKDVSAAYHDADFNAKCTGIGNITSNSIGNSDIDSKALTSHQRLTRCFQQHTFVDWLLGHLYS